MRPSLKLGIVGGSFVGLSVLFGFIAFDQILGYGIRDQTALRKRNEVRSIYLKIPFPLDFRVYFFNVSNPMEVQSGEIPILKEVGPYCYDEFKEKIDVVDDSSEDTLTYTPYDIFKYNQSRSGNLKEDDYVTIIHPLVVGIINKVTQDSPALLSFVNQAIGHLFPDTKSIYLTAKVRDILFDGIEINCKVTEFAAKAACTQIKSQLPGLKLGAEKNVFLFSLLGSRNATEGKRITVKRGISKSSDLGRLVEYDGQRELTFWGSDKCNHFDGTDGWIIPPFLTPEEGVRSFSTDLCRNVVAEYIRDTEFKGVNVRRYEVVFGDQEHNEEDKCYCRTPTNCLKKGLFDLTKCMGAPIYASLPHFLATDEIYLQQVKGLNPEWERHILMLHLEPMTGTPIEAKKRIQFNLAISSNSKITFMQTLPEALHPIFWLEEGIELEGYFLRKVTNIFLLIKVVKILRWVGVASGLAVMAYALHLYLKNKKTVKITPISQLAVPKGMSGTGKDTNGLNATLQEDNNNKKATTILSGHEFDKY